MITLKRASTNRLLRSLPHKDLERLLPHLNPVVLPQKKVLYDIGDPIDYVYFLEQGLASILTVMSDGASIEVGMTGMEGMVGISMLLGQKHSQQLIVMQLAGSAFQLKAQYCRTLFEQSAASRKILLNFINNTLNLCAQNTTCNRLHTVQQRAARWLLMSSDRTQSNQLPLTHEYLAAMIGVRRSGISEIASKLQRAGVIRYHHGQIRVLDRKGLEKIACECYPFDRERFEELL